MVKSSKLFTILIVSLLAGCGGNIPSPPVEASGGHSQIKATDSQPGEESQIPSSPTPDSSALLEEPTPRQANADVIQVRAVREANGTWTFYVTVKHPDTGWDDYADGWDVVAPDGVVLKLNPADPFTRLLLHPHVDEQPFTRGQAGIVVPDGVNELLVRAHDIVDGFGGQEILLDLEQDSGPGYIIER